MVLVDPYFMITLYSNALTLSQIDQADDDVWTVSLYLQQMAANYYKLTDDCNTVA